MVPPRLARALTILAGLSALGAFEWIFRPYFPLGNGEIGAGYARTFPLLYDGAVWSKANGVFTIPWFSPSFCGGVPAYPNPESAFYSAPQLLDLLAGPMLATHVATVLFAGVGFGGFYLLVRRALGGGRIAAVLGGALFALNGAYLWRSVAGHPGAAALMLVPVVAWATLKPLPAEGRDVALLRDSCFVAAAVAYTVHAGAIDEVLSLGFSVLALAALCFAVRGARAADALGWLERVAGGTVLGGVVAAGKITASIAFLSRLPGAPQHMPGARGAVELATLVTVSLASHARSSLAHAAIAGRKGAIDLSEVELGVGVLPVLVAAIGLLAGVVVLGLRLSRGAREADRETQGRVGRSAGWALLILALLALPIAQNLHDPRAAAASLLPAVLTPSSFLGLLTAYVPLVIATAAVAVDRVPFVPAQLVVAAVAVASLVVAERADRSADYPGGYLPDAVVALHHALATSTELPTIGAVGPAPDGAPIAPEISVRPCDGTALGLAVLPPFPTELRDGPVTDPVGASYNLLDPSCMLFPAENDCARGDRLSVEKPDRFERFRTYAPMPFARPWWQRFADAVSAVTSLVLLVALGFALAAEERTDR